MHYIHVVNHTFWLTVHVQFFLTCQLPQELHHMLACYVVTKYENYKLTAQISVLIALLIVWPVSHA